MVQQFWEVFNNCNIKPASLSQIGIVMTGTVGMTVTVTTTVTAMVPLHQETTTETIPLLHIVVLHRHQGKSFYSVFLNYYDRLLLTF